MRKLVECVPNISNGRDPEVYNTVARACEKINGVQLLDVDPGEATNRTVITFAGSPDVIVDAAFEVIKCAKELIDMRTQTGEHPRMGATDVCPFVPVSGVTMDECVTLAKKLGERVGRELNVWAYLYESAASKPEWQNLAVVRKGEYEHLASRVGKDEWKPDFGPKELDPKFGAVAISARKFLVAYNINLNSTNKKLAKDIAWNIREKGRAKREFYPDGEIIRQPNGKPVHVDGQFKHCKAGAWIIPEYNRAQITMNLTDMDVTPVHKVFDEVEKQAHAHGMRVTGSEIIGLVPKQSLIEAGLHYLKKQGLATGVCESEIIRTATMSLGLNDTSAFDPEDKIVEYRFKRDDGLAQMRIDEFADMLASDAPAPGGGSTAALCGSLAASLAAMVSNLTFGKKEYKEHWAAMEPVGYKGQRLKEWFLDAIDRDTDSFNVVMDAMRLPKKTAEEKDFRNNAVLEANKKATLVPLEVLEKSIDVLPNLLEVARCGNPNSLSDAGVGAHCLLTCAESAALNVKINLKGIDEKDFIEECELRTEKALVQIRKEVAAIVKLVNSNL